MGVRRRAWIAQELIRLGRDPKEPCLFVERATTPKEARVLSRLEDVAEGKVEVAAPAVWVIGKVVEVFDILQKTPQAWALAEV
jgi:uroporphyrin-III C-methyltransferase